MRLWVEDYHLCLESIRLLVPVQYQIIPSIHKAITVSAKYSVGELSIMYWVGVTVWLVVTCIVVVYLSNQVKNLFIMNQNKTMTTINLIASI